MFKKSKFKTKVLLLVTGYWLLVTALSGCVVRTYKLEKERLDQDLDIGNRGYLKGQPKEVVSKPRKTKRTTQVVEIEFHSPIKFERMPSPKVEEKKPVLETEDKTLWGNLGFITQREIPEIKEPQIQMQKYTVQKGDTLQKISKRYYGTSKKWTKIYEVNKNVLKAPDKIYPGQVINIPIEPLKETKEIKGYLK